MVLPRISPAAFPSASHRGESGGTRSKRADIWVTPHLLLAAAIVAQATRTTWASAQALGDESEEDGCVSIRGGTALRSLPRRSGCEGDIHLGLSTGGRSLDVPKLSHISGVSLLSRASGIAPVVPTHCGRAFLRLELPSEEPAIPDEIKDDTSDQANLSDDFEAGMAYGAEIRGRFFSPRIDDPGLPLADSLVCVCGALFVAQWALNPAIPPGIRIPLCFF